MRIKPNLVCMFEQNVEESVRKLSNRRIDPLTGEFFNVEMNPPKFNAQAERLITLREDEEENIKKRYGVWSDNINKLEETYKNCLLSVSTDRLVEQVFDTIKDAIENPIFWERGRNASLEQLKNISTQRLKGRREGITSSIYFKSLDYSEMETTPLYTVTIFQIF